MEGYASTHPHFNFPNGACGDTSDIGRYLGEVCGLDAVYLCATRPADSQDQSHAWIEVDGVIVDLTADQFGEPPVIVTRSSLWASAVKSQCAASTSRV